MRIANIMFSRGLGGIEQAFLDYNEALILAGHEVLAVTHPLAQINSKITGELTYRSINNFGNWDALSSRKLKLILKKFQPDATITHGNRALNLTQKAKKYAGLHIGVTHNYNLQHFHKLDIVFAITKNLQHAAVEAGTEITHIMRIPNMVKLHDNIIKRPEKKVGETVVIGTMGRMVAKKGFDHLIKAASKLKILTRQPFKIIIGGEGEEKQNLEKLIKEHKLEDYIELCGWVDDKESFYNKCDIFCLPSLHEPFGIVLLEAMSYGVPIVSYESEGPHEIFMEHPDAGLLSPLEDIGALAEKLSNLINNPAQREFLSKQSRLTVESDFSLPVISQKIDSALKRFIH